jgi:hypothetical protein
MAYNISVVPRYVNKHIPDNPEVGKTPQILNLYRFAFDQGDSLNYIAYVKRLK